MSKMEARFQISIAETARKLIGEHSNRILQGTKEQLAEVKEDILIITHSLQSISVDEASVTTTSIIDTDCRQIWQKRKTDSKTL